MSIPNPALDRAIKLAGGKNQFAAALGVLPQHVNNWIARGLPVLRCAAIEVATHGAVTRYDLRPDVFGLNVKQAGDYGIQVNKRHG